MQILACKKNTDVILFSSIDVAFHFGSVSIASLILCTGNIFLDYWIQ